MRAPRAFYVKCRPGLDVVDIAKKYRRVFIGYPAVRAGVQPDRHHMQAC